MLSVWHPDGAERLLEISTAKRALFETNCEQVLVVQNGKKILL